MADVRAIQRTTRQSPYKMRLVIDQIRGKDVNEALALLTFSKKHAAKQIEKVLKSAVANAEQHARAASESLDADVGGVGSLKYYGNPRTVHKSAGGVGSISKGD